MMKKVKKTHAENISLKLKDQASFNNKVKSLKAKLPYSSPVPSTPSSKGPGVIFIKHIPHGFYEQQMKAYFSQFGQVNRLRISRSKKTARSKGYGYIEFQDEDVAKIAANSMNNYLMFHHLIKCEFVPSDKLHPETFKGAGKVFRPSWGHNTNRRRQNKEKTAKKLESSAQRRLRKMQKTLGKLSEVGVTYKPTAIEKVPVRSKEGDGEGVCAEDTQPATPVAEEAETDGAAVESLPKAKRAKVAENTKSGQIAKVAKQASPVVMDTTQQQLFSSEEWSDDDDDDDDEDDDDDIDFDAMFGVAPTRELRTRRKSSMTTPSKKTPSSKAPSSTTPSEKAPKRKTPSEKTPKGKTPSEKTPNRKTPVRKTPAKKTPDRGKMTETLGSESRKRKGGVLTRSAQKKART